MCHSSLHTHLGCWDVLFYYYFLVCHRFQRSWLLLSGDKTIFASCRRSLELLVYFLSRWKLWSQSLSAWILSILLLTWHVTVCGRCVLKYIMSITSVLILSSSRWRVHKQKKKVWLLVIKLLAKDVNLTRSSKCTIVSFLIILSLSNYFLRGKFCHQCKGPNGTKAKP